MSGHVNGEPMDNLERLPEGSQNPPPDENDDVAKPEEGLTPVDDIRRKRWNTLRQVCHLRKTVPRKASELLASAKRHDFKAAAHRADLHEGVLPRLREFVKQNPENNLEMLNFKNVFAEWKAYKKKKGEEDDVLGRRVPREQYNKLRERIAEQAEVLRQIDAAVEQLLNEPQEIRWARAEKAKLIEDGGDCLVRMFHDATTLLDTDTSPQDGDESG